ncbi:hypothetical protein BDZ89DRAFT_501608 [Hymenopellis radicata]|nr:hypothetical protein BDZ89DRAFT_501608 [Hymenopellis radicata]
MLAAAMRRVSTLVREDPTRAKSYIFWATEQARKLVVEVLKEESAEKFGLRTPVMFQKIMDRFPDDKLPDHLIPPAANHQPNSNSPRLYIQPPHPTHPIRSGQYLKSVVLAEMESKGQVELIRIIRGKVDENGNRIDTIHSKKRKIHENMATDVADKEEFRWRLVPGAALTPFPEVTPGEMFDMRAEDLRETMGPRRGGSSSRGEKRGPPRDFLYDRRDKPPFTRSAHQPSNAGASGSSSPLLRTLSQAPGHERFRSTYQRSPAGQRRHYTSAREMWPNSQTETSLPRSPYMKSESRRAPGALAPVSTEPARPSFNPLATRPAGYGYLEDRLVFFHDKDKVPQKEEVILFDDEVNILVIFRSVVTLEEIRQAFVDSCSKEQAQVGTYRLLTHEKGDCPKWMEKRT